MEAEEEELDVLHEEQQALLRLGICCSLAQDDQLVAVTRDRAMLASSRKARRKRKKRRNRRTRRTCPPDGCRCLDVV